MNVERVETQLDRSLEKTGSGFELTEVLLGDRAIQQRNRQAGHLERLIETSTSFDMTFEFLILDAEIEERFGVGWIFVDLLQTQREIEPLLRRNMILAANFPVVMHDDREGAELQIRGQAVGIDDLVNHAMK